MIVQKWHIHSVESALWIWLFSQAGDVLHNPPQMMGSSGRPMIMREKQCPPTEGCVAELGSLVSLQYFQLWYVYWDIMILQMKENLEYVQETEYTTQPNTSKDNAADWTQRKRLWDSGYTLGWLWLHSWFSVAILQ